jgi:hypothetical protein
MGAMKWRGKLGGALAALVVGGFFYFMWVEADNDRKARAAKEAEDTAKAKADYDATARLLSDKVATRGEIEKRLNSWITVKDEVYILEARTASGRQLIRTVPRNRAWSVTCVGGVLAVEFPTLSADEDEYALRERLLPGKLDAEQCRTYVAFVADKMSALTRPR